MHVIRRDGRVGHVSLDPRSKYADLLHDSLQTWRVKNFFLSLRCAEPTCMPVLRGCVAPQRKRDVPALEIHTDVLTIQFCTCTAARGHVLTLPARSISL